MEDRMEDETLEFSYSTSRVECTIRYRKTGCDVSGRPCTLALVGVGVKAGDYVLRIPCFTCSGFPIDFRDYMVFYLRQVTALLCTYFPFTRSRCGERVAEIFVWKFLNPQICPFLNKDAVPSVVRRFDMEVEPLPNPRDEGLYNLVTLTPEMIESMSRKFCRPSGVVIKKIDYMDIDNEELIPPREIPKMPCDHVFHQPNTPDWCVNRKSCPVCLHYQQQ